MNWKRAAVICALVVLVAGTWWKLRSFHVDMLLVNCVVPSFDDTTPRIRGIAIERGRIVSIGPSDELRRHFDADSIVDLHGNFVFPGFVDAHAHLEGLGIALLTVDLVGAGSVAEVQSRVAKEIEESGGRSWVRGRGWDQNLWTPQQFPDHAMLDAVSNTVPIFLGRIDGHAVWVNRRVLELAGVTRTTPDPPGGRILRGADGQPTGVFVDNAMEIVRAVLPPPTNEERSRAIKTAVQTCLRLGLVGVHDMGVDDELISIYRELIAKGEFPFRVYAAVDGVGKTWDHYCAIGPELGAEDGRLTVRALKLYADGALGSRGAALIEPYSDEPGNRGLTVMSSDSMRAVVQNAIAKGFQVCTHAIGDRANAIALKVYGDAIKTSGKPASDLRLRIEHAQVLDAADIPRFAELGVIPSMQPTHCTSDMPWAIQRLGTDRIKNAYAWRSLLSTGSIIPAGSDFPVESPNPLWGFYAAVTRQDRHGHPEGGWFPGQCMTREEALKAFTLWPAYASFREDRTGMLAPGKWADLVVLSKDILHVPSEEILNTEVEMTVVAGAVAYRAAVVSSPEP
jgi:predicted amidohydrolase YtcJ